MKNHNVKRALVLAMLLMPSICSFAQDEIDKFVRDTKETQAVVGAYIAPFMKSLSLGLNQGWYNTAKPHKLIGIDITVTVSALQIPNKETMFNVGGLGTSFGLKNDKTVNPDYPNAPTIFGSSSTPTYTYTNPDGSVDEFEGPSGLGMKEEIGRNIMPVPMAHLGIGLPKGTDLKIRFVPTIDLDGDGAVKLFGIGVMHDIKQHIPGIKLLPFDLSGFFGYTQLGLNYQFDDGPTQDDPRGEFKVKATTIQGIISKKFSVLTLYGGLGYNIAKSSLKLKGDFEVGDDEELGGANVYIKNPVDLSFAASGPRVTAGFRLKLAILTLHADYTLQKYNALTVGVGLSVR